MMYGYTMKFLYQVYFHKRKREKEKIYINRKKYPCENIMSSPEFRRIEIFYFVVP